MAVIFQNRPSQKLHAQKKIKWADGWREAKRPLNGRSKKRAAPIFL